MLNIKGLYYITHIDNLPSIFAEGILSHERIRSQAVQNTPIYYPHLVNKRKGIYTSDDKNLWHYVNLFFQPRNSMLFNVIKSYGKQNLSVLSITNSVLHRQGIFITDGIATNKHTQLFPKSEGLKILAAQRFIFQTEGSEGIDVFNTDSWITWNDSEKIKRQLMAECLVPNKVDPKDIQRFIVADHSIANSLRGRISDSNIGKLVVATDLCSNIFTPFR
ncbi:MAG: DUF4433 domain-containing protein [Candidatus Poribacteria bacterium]|nr:DUF4433 domain-containing protein [Candidatus Poribacteria bacterium]